mmetsp:Transcript_29196/g.70386  ORF Transcript_29196/g.70386 Transcript_29196/m.70386 type:complete len:85 (+) Transcript_29196:466-720(+)
MNVHMMHVPMTETKSHGEGMDRQKNDGARTEKIASSVTRTSCNQIKAPVEAFVSLSRSMFFSNFAVLASKPKIKARVNAVWTNP